MSTTPPSDSKNKNTSGVGAGHETRNIDDSDWRISVQQSYRNTEVRQIAKVLASLEPGASESSKLRLAMQFEDSIFKVGTSLTDYHNRISKRLKKLQKNYKPPATTMAIAQKKEQAIQELIRIYGDTLKYVCKHEEAAVKEMRIKYGEEKGIQLQQHIDQVKQWAIELGLLPPNHTKPNYNMSDGQLEKMSSALEKRLETLRSHTVKLVDGDLFLDETLQKVESEFGMKTRAVRVQAENTKKRYDQVQRVADRDAPQQDPTTLLPEALRYVQRSVPNVAFGITPSTRNQGSSSNSSNNTNSNVNNKTGISDEQVRTAKIHLDRLRAASTLVLAYLCTTDKLALPPNILTTAHQTAVASMQVVQSAVRQHRQLQPSQVNVRLEDSWLKHLQVPPKIQSEISDMNTEMLSQQPLYLRCRALLTSGRKTPFNLVQALKERQTRLIRPTPAGDGTFLVRDFAPAFTMTIYLAPLRCEVRAYQVPGQFNSDPIDSDAENHVQSQIVHSCIWKPLHYGLLHQKELSVGGMVNGSYKSIGMAVQERLRDASAWCTHQLRLCFAKNVTATNLFEVELQEASALLEFLQLAQDTYTPAS